MCPVATPASGYGFGGWWGDLNVDGSNTPTLTTAFNANATVTAGFVPCDGPFLAMEEDLSETCVGCPVPVWTETGDSCLGVVQEGEPWQYRAPCMWQR